VSSDPRLELPELLVVLESSPSASSPCLAGKRAPRTRLPDKDAPAVVALLHVSIAPRGSSALLSCWPRQRPLDLRRRGRLCRGDRRSLSLNSTDAVLLCFSLSLRLLCSFPHFLAPIFCSPPSPAPSSPPSRSPSRQRVCPSRPRLSSPPPFSSPSNPASSRPPPPPPTWRRRRGRNRRRLSFMSSNSPPQQQQPPPPQPAVGSQQQQPQQQQQQSQRQSFSPSGSSSSSSSSSTSPPPRKRVRSSSRHQQQQQQQQHTMIGDASDSAAVAAAAADGEVSVVDAVSSVAGGSPASVSQAKAARMKVKGARRLSNAATQQERC
jgi:hypothetical protein